GNDPDFPRVATMLVELPDLHGRGMRVIAPGQKQHRGRRQIADVIGRYEVREPQSQAAFTHPNDPAAQALVPIRIAVLQTIGEGGADIDVATFQDEGIDTLEILSSE